MKVYKNGYIHTEVLMTLLLVDCQESGLRSPALERHFSSEEGVYAESHHTPRFAHIMSCGDSDRKTVQVKSQVAAQSASRPVPIPVEPDEESEVLARAWKLGTIEERLPTPIPPDDDVPEKLWKGPKSQSRGSEAVEGEIQRKKALWRSWKAVSTSWFQSNVGRKKNSHVDDLLEDVLTA